MERKTQCDYILDYIMEFGSITTFEAFTEIGCTRLASRICDLKKRGYSFIKQFETKKNRYGQPVSYIRYTIVNKAGENV